MSGTTPGPDTFIKRSHDPGCIVAWRTQYAFEAGKFGEEVITYGETEQRADGLNSRNDDKVLWPKNLQANLKYRDQRRAVLLAAFKMVT
jgi:hypothetical protein